MRETNMEKTAFPLKVDAAGGDVVFYVRAVPGASADKVAGVSEGALRVRVAAPANEGKANKRLIKFLAKELGLPGGGLEIGAGEKGRLKKIIVSGANRAEIEKKLVALCHGAGE